MSERKVLNKYYPPDFDPSKIPKGKRNRNATFNIRIMAPFNMRCNTCKDYIYKGKKFNSRKEDVMDEDYLGLKIFRFYIKCPRCVSEIAFKTDLQNTDYTLEAGATRLFEAEKLAQQMAEQERKEKEEDEMNPMKVLENRTKASRLEMEQIDSLEELRELNSRKNVFNTDEMIEKYRKYEETLQQLQMEQEEKEIQEIFGSNSTKVVKRLHDSDSDEEAPVEKKIAVDTNNTTKPTDILAEETKPAKPKTLQSWEKSVGSMNSGSKLKGLIVKKKTPAVPVVSITSKTGTNSTPASNSSSTEAVPNGINSSGAACGSKGEIQSEKTEATENDVQKDKESGDKAGKDTDNGSSGSGGLSERSGTVTCGTGKAGGIGSLGLLGDYSSSDSDGSD